MIWAITARAILALFFVAALDVLAVALGRSGVVSWTSLWASLYLLALIGLGFYGLWIAFDNLTAPFLPRCAGFCLYMTGAIAYMEARSMFSRGYSLRILVDLGEKGGSADLDTLKSSYGQGMGLKGLLLKRIRSIEAFKLIKFQNQSVGPLTCPGEAVARITSLWRKALRLERVG